MSDEEMSFEETRPKNKGKGKAITDGLTRHDKEHLPWYL
jgi:hypothetical protein